MDDGESLLSEYQRRIGGHRSDLEAVDRVIAFMHTKHQLVATGDLVTDWISDSFGTRQECPLRLIESDNLMLLFWHLWHPTAPVSLDDRLPLPLDWDLPSPPSESEGRGPAPPLPPDMQQTLLEVIEKIEEHYFQPNPEQLSPPDELEPLLCSLYATAARAFALKRYLGYHNDDGRTSLFRALAAGIRFVRHRPDVFPDDPAFLLSPRAVTALVQIELFRLYGQHSISTINDVDVTPSTQIVSDYEQALAYLASGLEQLSDVLHMLNNAPWPPDDAVPHIEELLPDERADRDLLMYSLSSAFFGSDDVALAIKTCRRLLRYTQLSAVDLRALASRSEQLARALLSCYAQLPYPDLPADMDLPSWYHFWIQANGRVLQRLDTSELLAYVEDQKRKGHEDRLKAYFFRNDLWNELPEETRAAIISVDIDWAGTELGRVEDALESLRFATESLFREAILKPLVRWQEERGQGELMRAYLAHLNAEPSLVLTKYLKICHQQWFKDFIAAQKLLDWEKSYLKGELRKNLPEALEGLINSRNASTHYEDRVPPSRANIDNVVRQFLGIGSVGVLPTLAMIKRKLNPSVPARPCRP